MTTAEPPAVSVDELNTITGEAVGAVAGPDAEFCIEEMIVVEEPTTSPRPPGVPWPPEGTEP